MDKRSLIDAIISKLNEEVDVLTQSAKAAHEAATHEESKAEDAHDTRGLEASYLAGAQLARLELLKKSIHLFHSTPIQEFSKASNIGIGALVEVAFNQRAGFFFIVSHGGGLTLSFSGKNIQVITPQSPLGEALLGRSVGEIVEIEVQGVDREYRILGVS